ncbi:hypothetical protein HAX54_023204, partial [Datura stramonium]|nr:hypothetical protein [Datura stramonium]
SCIIDEVLKEVRLPAKSSYCLEPYRCSERIFAAARPKQCVGKPLCLSWATPLEPAERWYPPVIAGLAPFSIKHQWFSSDSRVPAYVSPVSRR